MQEGQQQKGSTAPWWLKKKEKRKAAAKASQESAHINEANGNVDKPQKPEPNGNVKPIRAKVSGNNRPERKAHDVKKPHHATSKTKNGQPTEPPVEKNRPWVPMADRIKQQFVHKPITNLTGKMLQARESELVTRSAELSKNGKNPFRTDEALWMVRHFLKQYKEGKLERFIAPKDTYKPEPQVQKARGLTAISTPIDESPFIVEDKPDLIGHFAED